MKKSIISLFVLSAVNISYADTTLYGSLRESIEWVNADRTTIDTETGLEVGSVKDSTLDVVDQASRFGVKGDEDLGNGMKAIYQLEFRVRGDVGGLGTNDRLAYAGLETEYGTVAIGKQWSPYYNAVDYNDIFNGSASYALYQGPFRIADAITYAAPEIWGVTLSGAMIFGTGATEDEVFAGLEDQDQIDGWNVAAEWDFPWLEGMTLAATYFERPDDTGQLVAAAAGYQNDSFRLGLVFEGNFDGVTLFARNNNTGELVQSQDDAYHYNLAGEYYLTDADTIRASAAFIDQVGGGNIKQYALGLEHKFSKRTLVWLEYAYTYGDELSLVENSDVIGDEDTDDHLISFGFRHDF